MTDWPRLAAVRAAVARYAAMDPAAWDTGLSAPGAREALRVATREVLAADLRPQPRLVPPRTLLIWCAANVFTAPLEWTALFAAWGSRVLLKAPRACPAPVLALAAAFEGLGVEAADLPHEQAWPLLDQADAVLGFGGDTAMAELGSRLHPHQRRSLHGHRVSVVVVRGHSAELARALARDAALYDGRGCLSPAAVLTLGDAQALCTALSTAMAEAQERWPRGVLSAQEGYSLRFRQGLARIEGQAWGAYDWAVTCTPLARLSAHGLPRMLPVHPVRSLNEAAAALRGWPLSTLCTDLPAEESRALPGFWRRCRPGHLQRPPVGREHDGQPVLRLLCTPLCEEL